MSTRHRSVVVGAGISGLNAARDLARLGWDPVVFEAAGRSGGLIRSDRDGGWLFEWGPNSFASNARDLMRLAGELGLESRVQRADPAAKQRLLYHRGRLEPVPTGPGALLGSRVFGPLEKLRLFAEPWIKPAPADRNESIAGFVGRRFGKALARTLADAFVSGVFAGDADKVGMRSAFPEIWEMEQRHGSLMKALRARGKARRERGEPKPPPMTLMGFPEGMEELVRGLARELDGRLRHHHALQRVEAMPTAGYRLHFRSPEGSLSVETEKLVLALPAIVAAPLIAGLDERAAQLVGAIRHAGLLVLHAGFSEVAVPQLPRAFGFLAPRQAGLRSLGWLFSSRVFDGRAPSGHQALTGFIGGDTDPAVMGLPEEAVREQVLQELRRSLGLAPETSPERFAIVRQDQGLPQMDLVHHDRIRQLQAILADRDDLALVGNWLGGVSMNDCIKVSSAAVLRLVGRRPESAGGAA